VTGEHFIGTFPVQKSCQGLKVVQLPLIATFESRNKLGNHGTISCENCYAENRDKQSGPRCAARSGRNFFAVNSLTSRRFF
jgi:hypothetical protein